MTDNSDVFHVDFTLMLLFLTTLQVKVECGTTNEIYAASEPNRCEYEFKYRSPAACASVPAPIQRDPLRDEL